MRVRSSLARRARKFPSKSEVKFSRLTGACSTKKVGSPPLLYTTPGNHQDWYKSPTVCSSLVNKPVQAHKKKLQWCFWQLVTSFLKIFYVFVMRVLQNRQSESASGEGKDFWWKNIWILCHSQTNVLFCSRTFCFLGENPDNVIHEFKLNLCRRVQFRRKQRKLHFLDFIHFLFMGHT